MTEPRLKQEHERRIAIAKEVANLLGNDWQYAPAIVGYDQVEYPAIKQISTGMILDFRQAAWNKPDRVEIALDLNPAPGQGIQLYDYRPYDVRVIPSITVSIDGKPYAIAKEITRRLLPEASEVYSATLARYNASMDYKARQDADLQKILSASPEIKEKNPWTSQNDPGFYAYAGKISLDGEVYPDSIKLVIHSLPTDLAIKIIKLIVK